jgi:hypothetical protein
MVNICVLIGMVVGGCIGWILVECFFHWAEEWGRPRAGDKEHPLITR